MLHDKKHVSSWKKVLESDLENIAIELKDTIASPCIVILSGSVGAGKTTFTKAFLDEESTSSPSYSIVNVVGNTVHADFYRIENREEIIHLELPLYMENKMFCFIEWGSNFINDIYNELGEDYKYYDLEILVNDSAEESDVPSRNFILNELRI